MKRPGRRISIAAAASVALVVLLRAILPVAIERIAAYQSRYALGLPARIDNVDLSLFAGRVVLEGVTIGSAPDDVAPGAAARNPPPIEAATALLHLERMSADLSWTSLAGGRVHFDDLSLEAPAVRLVRGSDGTIDPLAAARPLAPESDEEESEEDEEGSWPIELERFALGAPSVVVVDAASGAKLVEFGLERFALDGIRIEGGGFSMGGIGVDGPVLRVDRRLFDAAPEERDEEATAGTDTAAGAAAGDAPEVGYRIDEIDVDRMAFTWVSEERNLDVAVGLHAKGISAARGETFPLALELEIGDGRVDVDGKIGALPPSFEGKIAWSDLPLRPLVLAAVPDYGVWLRSGQSGGELAVSADLAGASGAPAVRLRGRVAVEGFDAGDPAGEETSAAWSQLEVHLEEVVVPLAGDDDDRQALRAGLTSVRLDSPSILYTRPSPALDALVGGPGNEPSETETAEAPGETDEASPGEAETAEAPGETDQASPGFELAVGSLEVTRGTVRIVDETVKPTAVTEANDLSIVAKDVRFPDRAASGVEVRAAFPKSGTLSIEGDLASADRGDFTIVLRSLALVPVSPYAYAAGGATLDGGQATLTTRARLRGSALQLDNDLVLRRLGVSLRDPDSFRRSFGVPVDLALALLRDPAGDIRISIPVRMDEKGTNVSTAKVIASAIRQALVGAVTAPLKILGGVFAKKDGEAAADVEAIASVAGDAAPAPAAGERIEAIAKLLGERPGMSIELRGRTGAEDVSLLAERILIERVTEGDGLPDLDGTSFFSRRRIAQALRDKAEGKQPQLSEEDRALYDRYVASVEVPKSRLDELARRRAQAVRSLLAAKGVAAERIAIGKRDATQGAGVVPGLALD